MTQVFTLKRFGLGLKCSAHHVSQCSTRKRCPNSWARICAGHHRCKSTGQKDKCRQKIFL